MPKRIYVGYVKEFNPKTGDGVIALSSESLESFRPRTEFSELGNFIFNIKDPICFVKTQVTQGMKVNLDIDDRDGLKGIYSP
jgi:hypothetical protein